MYISMSPEVRNKLFLQIIKDMASEGIDRVHSVREAFSYWPCPTVARCVYLKDLISRILVLVGNIREVVKLGDGKDPTNYPAWNKVVPSSYELEQERISQNLLKAEAEFKRLFHDCRTSSEPNFPLMRGRLFMIDQALKNAIWSATQLAAFVAEPQEIQWKLVEATSPCVNDKSYHSRK